MFKYIRRLYIANIEYYYLQMQFFYENNFWLQGIGRIWDLGFGICDLRGERRV
jgi:hypothetical protein